MSDNTPESLKGIEDSTGDSRNTRANNRKLGDVFRRGISEATSFFLRRTNTVKEKSRIEDIKSELSDIEGTNNYLESSENTPIGQLLATDNDLTHYGHRKLWTGEEYEFRDKKHTAGVMLQQVDPNREYAFRAIGNAELEAILKREGIGGEDYTGEVVKEGTLFAQDLEGAPLSMFDGRSYGEGDTRRNGGYIIVIPKNVVQEHAESPKHDHQTFLSVVKKISLSDIQALFRIRRTDSNEGGDYQYEISQVAPNRSSSKT